jgi:mono/diheme cytochrome c family protein
MTQRDLKLLLLGAALASLAILVVAPPLFLLQRQELPFERLVGDTAVSVVSRILGGDAPNPRGPGPSVDDEGRFAYLGSCALCHGARGDGRSLFGRDTYPSASDLTAPNVVSKSDAQLFWITKNGLAFTAMPSFARQYPDDNIWAIVSYVRALQNRNGRSDEVAPPTRTELAFADVAGTATQRGAAVYLAQGCANCHGAVGNAPDRLSIAGPTNAEAVRSGGLGMPAYGRDRLTDADLADLLAFVATLMGR